MTREEAIEVYNGLINPKIKEAFEFFAPELRENEDERIIQFFAELATDACGGPGQEYYEELGLNYDKVMAWLEKQKEQKSLNISAASEWLRKHVCSYMNSEYNEFHKCVEYDGSIDKERLINDFEEAMQKEQDECPEYCVRSHCMGCSIYEKQKEKPSIFPPGFGEVRWNPISSVQQKPAELGRQSIIDALTKWLTEKIAPLHKKSLDRSITEREEMFMAALLEMRSLVNSPDFQIGKGTPADWIDETTEELECLDPFKRFVDMVHSVDKDEFTEFEYSIINFVMACCDKNIEMTPKGIHCYAATILNIVKKESPSKVCGWTDEEETVLHNACEFIRHRLNDSACRNGNVGGMDYKVLYEKLKSLSERFNLQPQQEWSEEDEKCIKDIIICLEYLEREDTERQWNGDRNVNPKRYEGMIAKLKSLRPYWKPSEEEMKALKECGECKRCIKKLYEDLQKRYGTC